MRFVELTSQLSPTPASYLEAARTIESGAVENLRPIHVGVLSTFTAQVLAPYLVVEGAARELMVRPFFGPFGQLEPQAFDEKSDLYASTPDVVVVFPRLEELAPQLTSRFLRETEAGIRDAVEAITFRIEGLVDGIRRSSSAFIFVANFAPPALPAAGLADPSLAVPQSEFVQRCNNALAAIRRQRAGAAIFDYARLVSEHGLRQWDEPKLFYLGRIPFSVTAQIAIARRLVRCIRAAIFPPLKCLVLDLDHTLWGGILGEEGAGGIQLGEDYPGNVFKAFQKYLLSLKDRGVLLALASKNNESEVLEVFANHPDCILKLSDFAAHRINWEEKSVSLRAIAAELNIGLEAVMFFDDNPVERAGIRSLLPMVTVPEAPASPIGFIDAIEESGAFDRLALTAEDQGRAEQYEQAKERRQVQQGGGSPEEFLRSLEMVATIGPIDAGTLPRVAQLIAKTNQFNLTTRRHTEAQVAAVIPKSASLYLRLADRFGDHGLVGAALAAPEEENGWRVDTFLLSCRVIGRHAETALLAALARELQKRGATELIGEYLETPKNKVAASFYAAHGFEPIDATGTRWRFDLTAGSIAFPPAIEIIDKA